MTVRRYRDSARGLPLRWAGSSFGGIRPLSESSDDKQRGRRPPRCHYQEAFMTQMFVYGIAAIVVSVGAALFARQRRAAYAVVRPARPRRSRVR